MAGRPTKLNPEVQENICKTLQAGVDVETACRREGIGARTYYDWLRRGRDGEEPYASFVMATDKAMAEVEAAITYQIIKASKQHWQAGAWWVKFRHTRGAQRIELTGADGAPLNHALSDQAVDQIRRRILYGDQSETSQGARTALKVPPPPLPSSASAALLVDEPDEEP